MPQSNTLEKPLVDFQLFFDFALSYHEKEPIIANIIALSVPATIITLIIANNLKHKRNAQVQDKKNIMNYMLNLEKNKLKHNKRR